MARRGHAPAARAAALVRALALLHCVLLAVGVPIADSQGAVLQDCQKAWGQTFPGWSAGSDCAKAVRLTCNAQGMVTSMNMPYAGLSGSIPLSISGLNALTTL
ncbi:unnamed protein product [Closterium sp. NIES-54]